MRYNDSIVLTMIPGMIEHMPEKGAEMNSISDLRSHMEKMLTDQILPYWLSLTDVEHGGYYGYVSSEGIVDTEGSKGVVMHSRILWTFAAAYQTTKNEAYLTAAHHAYDFIVNQAMDRKYGGLYWMLDGNGRPLDLFKHAHNQAFGIYALSTYYLASGKAEALEQAMRLFSLLEEKWYDGIGYLEQLTRDFKPMSNDELSENGIIAERTMNTLLHIVEAYTVLYEVTGDAGVQTALTRAVRQITGPMYNTDKQRLEVYFDRHFHTILDMHSYGHDMEASWLIDRACDVLGDDALSKAAAPVTKAMFDHVMRKAFTKRGVYYESENGEDNMQRDWWVQAEAMIAIANDMQKYGDEEGHLIKMYELLDFLHAEVILPCGEWHYSTFENGTHDMKREWVGTWKCPYHNARMCMEIMTRFAS